MLAHYLTSFYRSVRRHRLYAALNIGGLAVGLAVFLLLLVTVKFEASYDRWLPSADAVYRLNTLQQPSGTEQTIEATSSGAALPIILSDFPAVSAGTRIKPEDVSIVREGATIAASLRLVDDSFFDVFDLPFEEGGAHSLGNAADLILSRTQADRLFPDGSAIGQTLTLSIKGRRQAFTVSGIISDLPTNSSVRFDMITLLSPGLFDTENQNQIFEDWDSLTVYTYLRIDDPNQAEAIRAGLTQFGSRRISGLAAQSTRLDLIALPDVHFFDGRNAVRAEVPGVNPLVVSSLGAVGVMILLIAAINYVNLATARSVLRSREVALRKVLGASSPTLVVQFLAESVVTAALAGMLGLALAEVLLPGLNAILGSDLSFRYWGWDGILVQLAAAVVVIGLASGAYPAIILSRYQPAGVLGASRTSGGGRLGTRIRSGLVVIQFAAAITLAICATIMTAQAEFIRRADVGFDRDSLIIIPGFAESEVASARPAILEALRRIPGVQAVGVSSRAPATDNTTLTFASRPGQTGSETQVVIEMVGPGYFEAYGLALEGGRFLSSAQRLDDVAGVDGIDGRNIMLNATAATALGFETSSAAVQQPVRFGGGTVTVAGVVRDARFRAPEEAVPPIVYVYSSGSIPNPVIGLRHEGSTALIMSALETAWRAQAPAAIFSAETADESMSQFYLPHEQRGRLFAAGAIVALLIGVVGLYGLAAFTTDRRAREIGLRKVLGASNREVLALLLKQFMSPVALSILVAWPAAYLAMSHWLSQFDQRTPLSLWFFLAGAVVAFTVAAVTIFQQARRASKRSPADALRSD